DSAPMLSPGGMIVSATAASASCSVMVKTDKRVGSVSATQPSAHNGRAINPADAAIRVRRDSLRFIIVMGCVLRSTQDRQMLKTVASIMMNGRIQPYDSISSPPSEVTQLVLADTLRLHRRQEFDYITYFPPGQQCTHGWHTRG